MKLSRRRVLYLAAGAAALPAVSRMASAQAYPARPVTIVVPFAAGGSSDVSARIVGEYMARTLGQQFIIENVPGAGGTTGSTRAMRAKADGYTILMGHMGTHAVSVSLYPNLAYKPDVDFEPIGLVIEVPIVLVARKNFPANDLKEFMAYVRANAAKLNMAHAGVGSNIFNLGLLLNSLLGVRPTLVPFTGAGPATNALLSGQVDYMCNGVPEAGSHIQAGMLKAYAVGTSGAIALWRVRALAASWCSPASLLRSDRRALAPSRPLLVYAPDMASRLSREPGAHRPRCPWGCRALKSQGRLLRCLVRLNRQTRIVRRTEWRMR
jgi:tripartite-type tricarboxylate transporter receptor subunit TctC